MSELRWIAPSSFKPDNLQYHDVQGLGGIYEEMWARPAPPPLILVGPSGVAKSLSIRAFAGKNGIPLVVTDGSEDLRRHHLVGSRSIEGTDTPFVCGDLLNAVNVAEKLGQCIYLVEEINACSPYTQKIFNPLCGDGPRQVPVAEVGQIFRVAEGAKLWVVGTMNRGNKYGGIYPLNEDLRRRCRMIRVDYLEAKVERLLLKTMVPRATLTAIDQMLRLARETRVHETAYAVTTGDIVQVLEDIAKGDTKRAINQGLAGKYEEADYEWFVKRVDSIFETLSV